MRILFLIFVPLIILCGYRQDDYYTRLDMLLGSTVGIMTQTTALPIIAGADKHYVVADSTHSYAWQTFINSRKRTPVYVAKQLNTIINGQAGAGDQKQFMDVSSGTKYAEQDLRLAREALYTAFFQGEGNIADYVERITAPQDVLQAAFAVDLPEMPDPDKPGFEKKLNTINLIPGNNDLKPEVQLDNELGEQLRVALDIVSGEHTVRGKKIISIPQNGKLKLGVALKGKTNLPEVYAMLLPVPEIDERSVDFVETQVLQTVSKKLGFVNSTFPSFDPSREPLVVPYFVPEGIKQVTLTIKSSKGPVYKVTEPVPDPKNPIPFVWQGENIAPGDYVLSLSAKDKDKLIESVPAVVRVSETKRAQTFKAKKITQEAQGKYYGYISILNSSIEKCGVTKLFVWLNGTENSEKKPVSTSLYITNAQFDAGYSSVSGQQSGSIGKDIPITVLLKDSTGRPIVNAHVQLYSRRNGDTEIDMFQPKDIQTDNAGVAKFILRTQIPGEAAIYALSDLIWINEQPVIIKINYSGMTE